MSYSHLISSSHLIIGSQYHLCLRSLDMIPDFMEIYSQMVSVVNLNLSPQLGKVIQVAINLEL